MEEKNNLRKIEETIRSLPDDFNILEEQIDVEVQMKYFEFTRDPKNSVPVPDVGLAEQILSDPSVELDTKQKLLVQLAGLDQVEAFRLIERFHKEAKGFLRSWSVLALQESRMILQSSLLGEQQVFVSTGLGGKGQQIRYFVVLLHQPKNEAFSKSQEKIIQNEFDFFLHNDNGQMEELTFDPEGFAFGTFLFPLKNDLQRIFHSFIEECNQYGGFLQENVILTNVKKLSLQEIKEFIINEKHDDKKN